MYVSDLHVDTVYHALEHGLRSIPQSHLDLLRMKDAGYALQVFAAFIDKSHTEHPWESCIRLICCLRDEIEKNSDLVSPVLSAKDLRENIDCGRMSAIISVEEGDVIEGRLDRVAKLHDLGVRMMTLTWNHRNSLAAPAYDADADSVTSLDDETGGLTDLGHEFVAELESRHMILDVSHLSDRGFYDLASIARRPFIASHSNARRIHSAPRNLTDDMIKLLAARGGIIGLNYYADFVGGSGGFEDLARHAEHIARIGGASVLALGSDFDGIPYNPLIPDCKSVPFFEEHLGRVGFTDDEIDGIMGGNAVRFFTENL